MALPQWMRSTAVIAKRATAGAICYIGGACLYRYAMHHRIPTWNDLPGIFTSWIFFALSSYGLEWFRMRRSARLRPSDG
jgi:uncharacterized BrkB/YihY/UPF0761 family membrane protein